MRFKQPPQWRRRKNSVAATAALVERANARIAEWHVDGLAAAGILPPADRYMPVITYPPITMYPPTEPETVFNDDVNPPPLPSTAYVHIPFCPFQCHFCHWVKRIGSNSREVDDYLDTLAMEMDLVVRRLGVDRLALSSVLFGGGTPTYLSPAQTERVMTDFTRRFDVSGARQFSVEAEPGSILGDEGFEKLRVLRSFGVNRISMGVQSFDDDILGRMRREHTAKEALLAIGQIRRAGIESISIDLIYAYPGLTVESWIDTMNTALDSGADALHLYRLRVNRHGDIQGRILAEYKKRIDEFPGVETIRLMKALGQVMSEERGFGQHFTRIFARSPEHVTQFMMDYCCRLTNVVGLGISSWSNYHRTFTQNVGNDFARYRERVRSGRLPIDRGLCRDTETEARRSLISPLKNNRLYKEHFQKRLGFAAEEHFAPELARLKNLGLVDEDDESIFLTSRGRFFADETVMQLHERRYLPLPEVAHELMPD
ncbi:MAG: coproporphyrinogen III oxidase family protein [Deltaproteobacteria bacterium]|nr:coproporphyrinogen III oxidase family protein [Deltaproteobacteria bacterium]